jgi:fido (protein-threonine AMPylation protein)
MSDDPPDPRIARLEEVVYQALLGKYTVTDKALRERIIRPLIASLWQLPLDKLPEAGGDVVSVEDDARNQITTLIRLERDWATRVVADIDLETIHCAVFGTRFPTFRKTEFVEDFGGKPPTELAEVQEKQANINRSLRNIDTLRFEPLDRKMTYLAWLFSSIIGAHVFADGNGRVARIAAQYCLRRWGLNFVTLPKVRNAPGWKRALHVAMSGDISSLASYMCRLIENDTIDYVEGSIKSGSAFG